MEIGLPIPMPRTACRMLETLARFQTDPTLDAELSWIEDPDDFIPPGPTGQTPGTVPEVEAECADGDTSGNCYVQVVPSQVQVSLKEFPLASGGTLEVVPPKSTPLPAAAS